MQELPSSSALHFRIQVLYVALEGSKACPASNAALAASNSSRLKHAILQQAMLPELKSGFAFLHRLDHHELTIIPSPQIGFAKPRVQINGFLCIPGRLQIVFKL